MSYNTNLIKAKQAKNDEFYTRYEDIEAELSHYSVDYFKDKVIYCPCDVGVEGLDVPKSNFIKYFENNKDKLKYRELLHTSIQEGFDFRSDYCKGLFDRADIVVTNPPFSLFKEFLEVLVNKKLNYLILGSNNAVKYKETFLLIKNNQLRLGYINVNKYQRPDNTLANVLTYWYTNMEVEKHNQFLLLTRKYNSIDYPRYLNFDGIDVSNVNAIPCDYEGYMGVPITFLEKYNPTQFELIGIGMGKLGQELGVSKNLSDEECKALKIESNDAFRRGHLCFRTNDGVLKVPFTRILIRRK
jgi:hypothetical protein